MIDPQEIIRDDLVKELKEQHNEQMNAVLLHPEVYKYLTEQSGWYWIREIFDEWCWTMTHDDGEFFNYLQSDYVKYEEDMYYVRKEDL
jgi:phage pi2 protein 07